MAEYDRVHRQQVLREAEGYVELASVGGSMYSVAKDARDRLAQRALSVLEGTRFSGRSLAQAMYLRGQALRVMERWREALEPLGKAAELDPRNLHVWLAMGWCHKRTGRLDLAIQALEEALSLESSEAIIHYNLACYWSLAGNRKLALAYLAQALEIDPNYRDLIAAEPDFDPIRSDPDFRALASVIV